MPRRTAYNETIILRTHTKHVPNTIIYSNSVLILNIESQDLQCSLWHPRNYHGMLSLKSSSACVNSGKMWGALTNFMGVNWSSTTNSENHCILCNTKRASYFWHERILRCIWHYYPGDSDFSPVTNMLLNVRVKSFHSHLTREFRCLRMLYLMDTFLK